MAETDTNLFIRICQNQLKPNEIMYNNLAYLKIKIIHIYHLKLFKIKWWKKKVVSETHNNKMYLIQTCRNCRKNN